MGVLGNVDVCTSEYYECEEKLGDDETKGWQCLGYTFSGGDVTIRSHQYRAMMMELH